MIALFTELFPQMMNKHKFDNCVQKLQGRKEEVLKLFLQGQHDSEIADRLSVTQVTVRKHIFLAHEEFKETGLIENGSGSGCSHRDELTNLFVQYRRAWVSNVVLDRLGYPSNHYFERSGSSFYIENGMEYFYRQKYDKRSIYLKKRFIAIVPLQLPKYFSIMLRLT